MERRARGAVGARPDRHRHQHDVHRAEARHRDRPEQRRRRPAPRARPRSRRSASRDSPSAASVSSTGSGSASGLVRVTSTRRSVRLTRAATTSSRAASATLDGGDALAAAHGGHRERQAPAPVRADLDAGAQLRPPPPGKALAGLEVGRAHVPAAAQSVSPPAIASSGRRTCRGPSPSPISADYPHLTALPCPKSRPFGVAIGAIARRRHGACRPCLDHGVTAGSLSRTGRVACVNRMRRGGFVATEKLQETDGKPTPMSWG